MLPRALASELRSQLIAARGTWQADRDVQRGGVEVQHALQAKYPLVGQSGGWFWLFPSPTLAIDPRTGVERRHHLYEERLRRAIKRAVIAAGLERHVEPTRRLGLAAAA